MNPLVGQNAVALVVAALSAAKEAGAFEDVATAMLVAIAAIVRRERGAEALDRLLDLASAAR
jgi:hypothetical protein